MTVKQLETEILALTKAEKVEVIQILTLFSLFFIVRRVLAKLLGL